jgi:hypothetical protein
MSTSKKGPGRPKRKGCDIKLEGIIKTPVDPSHIVEFKFAMPMILKKFFNIFKVKQLEDIGMHFTSDKIYIYNINIKTEQPHSEILLTTINGREIPRYYCKEPILIGFTRSNIEKVMKPINSNYSWISFVIDETDNLE